MATRVLRILDDLHYFRNHITAPLNFNPVPDLDAQLVDEIHVVQSCARNHGPANWHRLQPRHRSQLSRSADLRNDVFDLGDCTVRRKLVGDGPARSLAGEAELALESGAIDLYRDAVDLIRERFALRFPALDELP